MNYKDKGDIGEAAFLCKMINEDITVAKVFGDNKPFDFFIEVNCKSYRVQVKTGSYNEEKNIFKCNVCNYYYDVKVGKYISHHYSKDDIDLFAFYCIEKDKLCLLPFKFLSNIEDINISLENKSNSRQIAKRWFYEDIDYKVILDKLKNNEELENPLILNESLSTYKSINKGIPDYILQENDSRLIEAYKRAIKSTSGFRGVKLNDNKNSIYKYKCYFRQNDINIYLGCGNDPKELAILHDKKGEELLGNKAITNKKLGLL